MYPRLGAVLGALAIAWSCACGGSSQKLGEQPSWRQPSSDPPAPASASPGADIAQAPIVLEPPEASARAYNEPVRDDPPSTPLGDAVLAALDQIAADAGVAPPRPDPRLSAAAAELAGIAPASAPLPNPLVEFAMQHHGIIEPSPHIVLMRGPLDNAEALTRQLAVQLPPILAKGRFARVGVGAAPGVRDSDGVAVLALQESFVETRPIPRALPDGGVIRLEGRVLGEFTSPRVFVTGADGAVTAVAVALTGAGAFRAEVSCDGRRGRQQIELTAVDAGGSAVLANFPVWCYAQPPRRAEAALTEDDTAPVTTPAEAEARMLVRVNRDRRRHGLAALELDPAVSAVARAHSAEMQQAGVVAHVSPTTGEAQDRIRAAGLRTPLVLENVARAYGVVEAQEGLMNSPGHRANLLSPLATRIGIGIAFGEVVSGRQEMFVTQVLTRVTPRVDAAALRAQVAQRIEAWIDAWSAARTKAKSKARIRPHEPLDALAQQLADAMAQGASERGAVREVNAGLSRLSRRFKGMGTSITTVTAVEAFDPSGALSTAASTHYGLGVAQGPHETLGDNAIYIVIIAGEAR